LPCRRCRPGPVLPNAAIQRIDGSWGCGRSRRRLHFTPVSLGASDLDGQVQVREGLEAGDRVVVYSQRACARSRIQVVEQLPGGKP
jgi:HlyD family secretion protein